MVTSSSLLDRVGRHRTVDARGLVDRERHLKNMLRCTDVLRGLAAGEEAVDEVRGRAIEAEPPVGRHGIADRLGPTDQHHWWHVEHLPRPARHPNDARAPGALDELPRPGVL